jgi:hypothetical protein
MDPLLASLCLTMPGEALRRENIETLDQLRAVIDRLEQLEGIGPKTARVIRRELARVTSSGEPPACGGETLSLSD